MNPQCLVNLITTLLDNYPEAKMLYLLRDIRLFCSSLSAGYGGGPRGAEILIQVIVLSFTECV